MTGARSPAAEVSDERIAQAIAAWLCEDAETAVVEVHRRPWEYATSTALELVTAVSDDGIKRQFVLKHLDPAHASAEARRAKPSFIIEPRREIEMYRRVLAPLGVGPSLVASSLTSESDSCWLLLSYVAGRRLHEDGDLDQWESVGAWLGSLHRQLDRLDRESLVPEAHLIVYQRDWYLEWLQRARRFLAADRQSPSGRSLDWLAFRYDQVVARLMSLRPTIIHGEFYPANVLVRDGAGQSAVCPVDWEMAAVGPGLIDLAALTSGRWPESSRQGVIAAYSSHAGCDLGERDLAEAMQCAYIYLAVQWLGWFGRRRPPAEYAYDWLTDAVERAEALGL